MFEFANICGQFLLSWMIRFSIKEHIKLNLFSFWHWPAVIKLNWWLRSVIFFRSAKLNLSNSCILVFFQQKVQRFAGMYILCFQFGSDFWLVLIINVAKYCQVRPELFRKLSCKSSGDQRTKFAHFFCITFSQHYMGNQEWSLYLFLLAVSTEVKYQICLPMTVALVTTVYWMILSPFSTYYPSDISLFSSHVSTFQSNSHSSIHATVKQKWGTQQSIRSTLYPKMLNITRLQFKFKQKKTYLSFKILTYAEREM